MRILLLALISLVCPPAFAQTFPTKPLQIIVPLAPGGGTDLLARVIADKLRDKFGQPVTVENRSGAAGNIGADAVFKAAPDGHTLLFTQPAPLVVNKALYGKLTFEPEQFVPIALVSIQDIMLAVNPKVPASSLPELIAYARANPGKLNFGSSGAGSAPHLAAELFGSMAGVKMVHVPVQGQRRIAGGHACGPCGPHLLCVQYRPAPHQGGQAARDRRRRRQAQPAGARRAVDFRGAARL